MRPQAALTPFISYEERPNLHARAWNFGAKGNYRFDRAWSASLTVQVDREHNIEYALGVQRRH